MKGPPVSIRLFRFLLVLAVVLVCVGAPGRIQTILLAIAVGVGLWLLSSLGMDAKAIRRRLEEFDTRQPPLEGFQSDFTGPTRGAAPGLLDGFSIRKLGDRVFKADESKTCKTCQSFEPEGPVCRLDDESLAGITVSAVGCQSWSPGLKVAERLQDEKT